MTKQRRWIVIFVIILIVLTSLPYLWAAQQAGPDWVFGGFIYGLEDGHSYIAKMLRGAQGDWLFRSPYSTSEQGGALLYLPYLLLGKLFGPGATSGQLLVAFHAFRLLAIAVLCWALYDFFSLFLKEEANRRWGLLLATMGGGLGWLLLIGGQSSWLGSFPLEFISPETFGFLAVFGLPHLVLARALLLWGLLAYLRPDASPWWRTALLWLALALTHVLSAGLGILLIGLHWMFQRFGLRDTNAEEQTAATRQAGAALLGAGLPLAVGAYQLLTDSYLQGWAAQNLTASPSFWHYLLAFSIPLVLSFWGWRHLRDANARRASFLMLWLVALPILLYLPFGLQRRFAEGAWVALLVLALAAFEARGGLSAAWRRVMLLLLPSTLVLLFSAVRVTTAPGLPLFLPRDEVAVFEALREEIQDGDVLLSAYETGNMLPAWAPVRVVIGHGSETVDLSGIRSQVTAYYRGEDDGSLLVDQGVDYVFWGPLERSLGNNFNLQEAEGLQLLLQQGGYVIYKVQTP